MIAGDEILLGPEYKAEAKELGARFDKSRGVHVLPASVANARAIYDAIPDLGDLSGALMTPHGRLTDARLYDYQQEAAGRLVAAYRSQMLVMSPGLGKTAVAVRAADEVVEKNEQIVVVAPSSLLDTWAREIKKWSVTYGEVYVVRGKLDFQQAALARWIVVSWDKAVNEAASWGKGWPLWILDESVLMKSHTSKRFKVMRKLRPHIRKVWLLTGSPTTKYADDLWTQLHMLWPKAYPSYWRFAERYCVLDDNVWSPHTKVILGTRRGRDALEDSRDLVHVVNQEDVLDLPEYLFETVDVRLRQKQAEAYRTMAEDFIAKLGSGDEVVADNVISQLQKLQQITSWWDGRSGKHDALIDLLPTYEGPHLVWTHWREGAEALWTRLIDAGYSAAWVSGSDTQKVKDSTLEDYKKGLIDVLILSIGVGKFGHTFTNTKTVHYIDKTWNADDYFQSLRRVRRIGLEHRPVVVSYRAPGTADELVELNLEGKLPSISRMTRSNLTELLRGLGK
jgi:SNF2 family DNA or RNA helicase